MKRLHTANCVFFQDNNIIASFAWQTEWQKKVTKKARFLLAECKKQHLFGGAALQFYFFTAAFLSAWVHRYTTTPAMTPTISRPGRKPVPTAPRVIRVPTWYTRKATV